MSDLHRLIYTSYRKAICDEEEIKKILLSCKRNNPKRGITGVLMHSNSRFVQYLEGEQSEITELYEIIKEDDRHAGANLRNLESIEKRIFPGWEMGYKDLSQSFRFETEVSEKDRLEFENLIEGEINFANDGIRILQMFFKMA